MKLESTFARAVEYTSDPIFITDNHGVIQYTNQAFEKTTGYSAKEAIGKTPRIIKSGKHDKRFYHRLWGTIKAGKIWRATVINRKKNGTLIYVDHTITPVKDISGKITNFVGIWKDISRQIVIEKQKDEFVNMVSHEFKTPLTSLKGFIQIMTKKSPSYYLTRIDSQVDKLIELVGDLLDVTKLNTGKFTLSKMEFDINDLVKEAVKDIQITVGNQYKIVVRPATKTVVTADHFRITQVLANLLTNAIKYSPETKKIIVRVKKDSDCVTVSVQDFGTGIPKEKQALVFTKYYRVHQTLSHNQRFASLGLGLFISQAIIRRHKGKIWCESTEGKGSIFYFSLPLL